MCYNGSPPPPRFYNLSITFNIDVGGDKSTEVEVFIINALLAGQIVVANCTITPWAPLVRKMAEAQLSDLGCFFLQLFYFFFDLFGVAIKLICLHMVIRQ